MSDEDESQLSALEENISKKGTNSYYYAHGKKIDGPKWDGKEEPRLLATGTITSSSKASFVTLDTFSWLDDKKSVKIYVDFENSNEIADEDINLVRTWTAFSCNFHNNSFSLLLFRNWLITTLNLRLLEKVKPTFSVSVHWMIV